MKTERNILIAFILNLGFSILEFIGGAYIGSVAIISDAMHDMGDALSIGVSYMLEKMSKKEKLDLIDSLTKEMNLAAKELNFERAMELRDIIFEIESE